MSYLYKDKDRNVIIQIRHDSEHYKQSVQLRNQVLRIPIGLLLSTQDMFGEKDQLMYGYFENGIILSTVQFILKDKKAKLRQFATHIKHRNRGLGNKLYHYCESELLKLNFNEIYCHCRLEAVPFYIKNGFKITSEEFIEVGIVHVKMTKQVSV